MKFSVVNEFRVSEWQNKLQFDYTRKWRILKHMMFIIQNESTDEYCEDSQVCQCDANRNEKNTVMPFHLKEANSVCHNNTFKRKKKSVWL